MNIYDNPYEPDDLDRLIQAAFPKNHAPILEWAIEEDAVPRIMDSEEDAAFLRSCNIKVDS